jgi:predicted flap endonuclease-1-like 5' DNA nuclease
MSDKEAKLREQLEEEAKVWVKEEFARRFTVARETMEKQGRETEEHLRNTGIKEKGQIASETQLSISYAKTELYKDVQFEADNWIEEEVRKRLKEGN